MAMTKLAHKYVIPTLLEECEHCLKNADEIAVIDRLLLADRLKLQDVLVSQH